MQKLFLVLFIAMTPLAAAQARSIEDCEKISNAMAYNECLAEFSPARRHHASTGGQRVDPAYDPPPNDGGKPRARSRVSSVDPDSPVVQRTKGGRKIAVFDVGSSTQRSVRRRR